ncbi:MAG: hypothetical protein FWH21_00300 [Kiritimatiellaeota bacterium]|nr:hypothetical protein [Kiritimatiellota bacterium]
MFTNANPALFGLLSTNITFDSGISVGDAEYVTLTASTNTPSAIRKSMDTWKWQATAANGTTVATNTFAHTGPHTAYVIFNEPQAPWTNVVGAVNNAWTNALEFVIDKTGANGKATAHDALSAITSYLHSGHGMSYDTNRGATAFINLSSTTFDFTSYINPAQTNRTVNCYDQAGGVYVTSRLLGIPSEFVFMGLGEDIYGNYNGKPPFGYIRAINLVGVGLCNNPFAPHATAPNNILLLNAPSGDTNLVSPNRTSFGNHAFVRYTGLIYDACAGPYLGVGDLQQYATASIDITSIPERQWSPDSTGWSAWGVSWSGDTNGVFSATEVNNAVDPAQQMIKGVQ